MTHRSLTALPLAARRFITHTATAITLMLTALSGAQANPSSDDPSPSVERGMEVYRVRCALCHGAQAAGDGLLPIKISNYPNTSLLEPRHARTRKELLDINIYGGSQGKVSIYMPPFGQELSWTDIESVTDFIALLRTDKTKALALLNQYQASPDSSVRSGRELFASRCTLCHGTYGEGDGRMAKLLKDPPPANLTRSTRSTDYLFNIISKGGEAVGRSKHMPPWGTQLNETDIGSLVLYIQSIRLSDK